jgi:hypothetical protein
VPAFLARLWTVDDSPSLISPVAILATLIAAPITSAGRFSPRGPRGIQFSLFLMIRPTSLTMRQASALSPSCARPTMAAPLATAGSAVFTSSSCRYSNGLISTWHLAVTLKRGFRESGAK